jgi:PadR family transcriptional regulator, regulatory protein PadR
MRVADESETTGRARPVSRLLKEELVKAEWSVSAAKRRIRIYKLTPAGGKRLERQVSSFERMLEGIERVLAPEES